MPTENIQQHPELPGAFKILDLLPLQQQLLMQIPGIPQFLRFGADARSHKTGWVDDPISKTKATLTANIAAHAAGAAGLTITVDSSAIFEVDDQVTVDTMEQVYQVTAIPGGGLTLTVTDISNRILSAPAGDTESITYTRAQLEKSVYGTGIGARAGDQVFNFTQIFRKDIEVSWEETQSSQNGLNYTYPQPGNSALANATDNALREINQEIYHGIMRGWPQERTGTSVKGFMGGIRYFITQALGNIIDAAGAALTLTNLNDMARLIYDDANNLDNIVILAGASQGQKLATLDPNAIRLNFEGTVGAGKRVIGTNVMTFIPDLSGGRPIPVMIDANMPSSEMWWIDTSRIELANFTNFGMGLYDAQTPGTTANQKFVYGIQTLRVRNGSYAHGIIKSLSS